MVGTRAEAQEYALPPHGTLVPDTDNLVRMLDPVPGDPAIFYVLRTWLGERPTPWQVWNSAIWRGRKFFQLANAHVECA